ncbi:MAG TPA: hypothetical protein VK961_05180 [Chthoniobacter sp.]|nr:hypothetical protein [Chthoniobacter sp.]
MNNTLSWICALGVALLVCGCESDSTAKKEDRVGAHGGVVVSSHDMSRVAPTRTVPTN